MPPKATKKAKRGPAPRDPKKALTKSQLHSELAERTGLEKKQVGALFAALEEIIGNELRGRAGKIGLMSGLTLKKKETKARASRPGRNPFTGEEIMIKAKPAGKTVRATIGKNLKEMV